MGRRLLIFTHLQKYRWEHFFRRFFYVLTIPSLLTSVFLSFSLNDLFFCHRCFFVEVYLGFVLCVILLHSQLLFLSFFLIPLSFGAEWRIFWRAESFWTKWRISWSCGVILNAVKNLFTSSHPKMCGAQIPARPRRTFCYIRWRIINSIKNPPQLIQKNDFCAPQKLNQKSFFWSLK